MKRICSTGVAMALMTLMASTAFAADPKITKAPPEPPPPPPAWWDTLTIDGFVDGGVVINPSQPFNKLNWGHLYTDRANTPQFNGALLTVQRPLDPKAEGVDFGFKVQGQIGTDARYNHFLGELDYLIHDRTQLAVIEAHALAHLPILTEGGIDVKVGQFVTYNGFEVIPAKDNLFYTHSYMFNFGPFKHTGAMVTTHATSWLDVYTGVTTGLNTSIGWPGDNNNSPSIHGGLGLNLLDGKLTIIGFTHAGPENPKQLDPLGVGWPFYAPPFTGVAGACLCNPTTTWRYYNNLTTTYKPTDNLTFALDLSYMRENGWNGASVTGQSPAVLGALGLFAPPFNLPPLFNPQGADAYGAAAYASYKVNDIVKLNGRIEYFRDDKNFFIAAFPGFHDAVNGAHGFVNTAIFQPLSPTTGAAVGTSYVALTAGATITPEVPEMPIIKGIIFRPEVRWDTSANGAAPFFGPNGVRRRSTGLFAMDVIVPFSIR